VPSIFAFQRVERAWHVPSMKRGKKATLGTPSTAAAVAQGLVGQMGDMGCGVACVASVLRISYSQALKRFQKVGVKGDDMMAGFSRRSLKTVLKKAGREYAFHNFGPVTESERHRRANGLPERSIVYVFDKNTRYCYGHYLVRMPRGWMDPEQGRLRRTLHACPKSYLEPVER
jgi:hypothetical protein